MEYLGRTDSCISLDVVEHKRSYAGHTIYRVVLKVYEIGKPDIISEIFVWRRYREFKKLYKELKLYSMENADSSYFPELSKGKFFGRFETHTIEERMQSLSKFLKFIVNNHALSKSDMFKQFFEGAVKHNNANPYGIVDDAPIYLEVENCHVFPDNKFFPTEDTIDAAVEELDEASASFLPATWHERQPISDLSNDDNIANTMDHVESVSDTLNLEEPGDLQSISSSDICEDTSETMLDTDNQDIIIDLNPQKVHSAEELVFSDDKIYVDDEMQWLRRAISVCSDGEDINKLASEAGNKVNNLIVNSPVQGLVMKENIISNCAEVDGNQSSRVNTCFNDIDSHEDSIFSLPACPLLSSKDMMNYEDTNPAKAADCLDECTSEMECRNNNSHTCNCNTKNNCSEIETTVKNLSVATSERQPGLEVARSASTHHIENLSVSTHYGFDQEFLPIQGLDKCVDHSKNASNELSLAFDKCLTERIQKFIAEDDYIYQGSLAMSEAIDREMHQEFEAAFELYKLGIGIFLEGVKQDNNAERRKAVRRKTAQYLLKAESMYNRYVRDLNNQTVPMNITFNLSDLKALGVIDNVVLVQRVSTGKVYILKVLHKCGAEYKINRAVEQNKNHQFINSKFMVKMFYHIETSTGIYMLLEYISTGLLWKYIHSDWSPILVNLSRNEDNFAESKPSMLHEGLLNVQNDRPPEDLVRIWVAEIVLTIEDLHRNGVICRCDIDVSENLRTFDSLENFPWFDFLWSCKSLLNYSNAAFLIFVDGLSLFLIDLNPRNILLDEYGHIKLTYFSNMKAVEYSQSNYALCHSYASPESHGVFELTKATDWWSLGAILFELLSGKSLHSCYPNGIHSHSIIHIPTSVSNEAWSLLAGLLRYNPQDRLGAGAAGCEEIKSHPFFISVDWQKLEQ